MAHITGHVRIAAPLEQVFDTVADSRNEPSFNPAMTDVELLTPAPVGLGTRFLAHMGKANMDMVVELTEFERPHRLGSLTTSSKTTATPARPDRPQQSSTHDPDARELVRRLRAGQVPSVAPTTSGYGCLVI